jgi:2-methylcitrate dehydratase PrpD
VTTPAARLAAFAIDSRRAAIPSEVRERAKLHVLDTLGCGLAAVGLDTASHATIAAARQSGRPEASILAVSELVPAPLAALANGTRCHALDFDDTHEEGICHSSTVVAPSALAAGEASASSGPAVLDAYILGCEVALRIAIATADGLYARGFHPTGVCGAFGAAAAASRLLGLSVRQTTDAFGIVGSFASGLLEYLSDGSATKPLHAGWAAQAGIHAAYLARAGAAGPASVLEGRFGLVASHTGAVPNPAKTLEGLGETWEVANLAIKPFPACHFAHAPTWAAGKLAEEHHLTPDDIAEIVVRIPAEGMPLVLDPLSAKIAPRTPYDAKFSVPFTIAHHLVHGRLGLSAFSPHGIGDREVLALARRVRGEPLASPAPSRFAGGVRLVTHSGGQLDRFVAHAPGSPQNPLEEASLISKFRANAQLHLDPSRAGNLAHAIRSIDDAPSLDEVMGLARTPEASLAPAT